MIVTAGPSRNEKDDRFAVKDSPIHGRGLFATQAIPAKTRIMEYVGERITRTDSLKRCQAGNHFIFGLDEQFAIDGGVDGNHARFINHSCSPNCEAEPADGRVYITAVRDIQPGEELSFNYGYDLADYQDYPCRCGSPNCVGYIVAEAFFPALQRKQESLSATLSHARERE